jgi:uncharacterized protein DUF4230
MSSPERTNPGTRSTQIMPAMDGGTQVVYVPQPKSWGRRLLMLIGTLGVIVALLFGLNAINLWPSWLHNPFATQRSDRTGPVLLESVQDLSRYVAAEGNFQVLVDLQENNKYIPDFIFNERTLFVGVGSVQAYVDFSTLPAGAIKVSQDGKSVEITLPEPVLDKPNLDNDRSYVYAHQTGIINKVGDMFSGDPNKQQELYQLAELKISQAAAESELRTRAQTNTRLMLESLLKGLGFERVTVTFVAAIQP